MSLRPSLIGRTAVVLTAVVLTIATPAHAQTENQSWTMCSSGSLRTCNSIMIVTTPEMSGGVRVGTQLQLRFRNLQGSFPLDNSQGRTLFGFFIGVESTASSGTTLDRVSAFGTPQGPGSGGGVLPQVPNGDHTYGLDIEAVSLPPSFGGPETMVYNQAFDGVWGCDPDSRWGNPNFPKPDVTAYVTCGTDAWVSFDFDIGTIMDAEQMTTAQIYGSGLDGDFSCANRATFKGSNLGPVCEVVAHSVTPEPVTMTLLGTGLLGMAGVRLRRRYKAPSV